MSTPKTIRLLIADNHEITRIGLRTLFVRTPQVKIVGETVSIAETLKAVARVEPDVLLLDSRLSDGRGIEVCRQLRRTDVHLKVLMLSSSPAEDLVFDAILAGADGYLLKEVQGDDLVRAIRAMAEGKSVLDPAVTCYVMNRIRNSQSSVVKKKIDLLSTQERKVIALIAEGKTNKEIGDAMGLSSTTVRNYAGNAFEKLHVSRRAQAATLFSIESSETPRVANI